MAAKIPAHMVKMEKALRDFGLAFAETHEDFPWGHRALKVKGKIFAVMSCDATELRISTKLPVSRDFALDLPFTEPTGYGLGKSGWVTASFGPKDKPPLDYLRHWMTESYRAVAPKKLLRLLDAKAAS